MKKNFLLAIFITVLSIITFSSCSLDEIKCAHVDKHIPWGECDKCGLEKVYWE